MLQMAPEDDPRKENSPPQSDGEPGIMQQRLSSQAIAFLPSREKSARLRITRGESSISSLATVVHVICQAHIHIAIAYRLLFCVAALHNACSLPTEPDCRRQDCDIPA